MNTDDYFRKIQGDNPALTKACKRYARTQAVYLRTDPLVGIHNYSMPAEVITNVCPILADLHEEFILSRPNMFYMDPHTALMPHTDPDRHVSINMLIKGWDSKFLYFEHRNNGTNHIELTYDPDVLYICNSSKTHQVLNISEPRLLLTIKLSEKNADTDNVSYRESFVTFDDVVNYFSERSLLA